MPTRELRPTEVLLVEDSPGDVRLTQEAFRDAKSRINLHVTTDGADAMEFLRNKGPYADAPRPDLILLDLNMPGWTVVSCWLSSEWTKS